MKNITIEIHDDKTMTVVPVPVVEGENLTTQILITTPPSWDGYLLRCLMTTPRSKMVDPFDVFAPISLTNSMLDGNGTLKVEFIGTKDGVEVVRTRQTANIPVHAARKPLGNISPEPLPDLLAEMVEAKEEALSAAMSADEAKLSCQNTEADTKTAEELRRVAENDRKLAEEGRNASYLTAETARNTAYNSEETNRNNAFSIEEVKRANAELVRNTAEDDRKTAEIAREQKITDIESLIGDINTAMGILEESLNTILGGI